MTPRRQLGDFGERVARRELESAGMRVLAANLRVGPGEIDLLAEDGPDLVFVEVRTRRAAPGAAAESLTPTKVSRMWQCAMAYCEANQIEPERARVDAVTVEIDPRGRVAAVHHFRGIEPAE